MITKAIEQESGYSVEYNDGSTLSVPNAPGNRHYRELMEWVDEGNTIEAFVPPTQYKTRFTAREFLRKLTGQERATMKTHEDMGVQLWYDELIAADFVDVEDPDTIEAANYGVTKGVFSEARKDELLEPEIIE